MKFAVVFLFLLISFTGSATPVQGVVKDPDGKTLSYVSIEVMGKGIGVSTGEYGAFHLDLAPGTYILRFTRLGYRPFKDTVSVGPEKVVLNVILHPRPFDMAPVTITADGRDPAYYIIRQVIDHKEQYQNQYNAYERQTYRKINLDKKVPDTLFTEPDTFEIRDKWKTDLLVEVVSMSYFKQPGKIKEIKEAYREMSEGQEYIQRATFGFDVRRYTGQRAIVNPYLFGVTQASADLNFYDNLLKVPSLGEVPYLSPVANSAFLSYRFELENTFRHDSFYIHQIKVTPRRKDGALFEGNLFIVDSIWAIYGVDLAIDPASMNYYRDFRLYLDYNLTQDSIWVLKRENYHYEVKDGKTIYFGQTDVVHSEYRIDPELPEGFFKQELAVTLDNAYDRDSSYWVRSRPVRLKPHEAEFIQTQDSIKGYHQSEIYLKEKDSIYNQLGWLDFLIFGIGHRNTYDKWELFINPLVFSAKPFWIGGYRHSLGGFFGKEWNRANALNLSGEITYGFNNRDIRGRIQTSYLYLPKQFGKFQIKYGNVYTMINTYESITASFSGSNYANEIYYGIGHEIEVTNGLFLDAEVEYAEQHALDHLELSEWSQRLFGELNEPVSFNTYDEFIVNIRLRYTPFQKYYTEPYKKVIIGSDWPTFSLNYRKGVKDVWSSDTHYDFLELSVDHDFKVGAFGTSKWKLFAGSFLTSEVVRITDYKFFRRSDKYFFSNPLRSFQLLRNPPGEEGGYINTKNPYLQVSYLHRFNGTLMNKIPLIRRLGLQTMAGAGMLYIQDQNFRHAELYAGLERAFRIRKQYFRIGIYFVTSDSNFSDLDAEFKFGIGFYNAFKDEWSF